MNKVLSLFPEVEKLLERAVAAIADKVASALEEKY